MDVQTYTEYEIVDAVSNESFTTREHYVALSCYKTDDMVFERHVTIHNPSPYTQTKLLITRPWHNNPEFREEE